MNILAQLKQPIIDGDGTPKTQVVADFYVDDDNLVANTAFGVAVIRREDVGPVVMILPDEFDRTTLESRGHILILN